MNLGQKCNVDGEEEFEEFSSLEDKRRGNVLEFCFINFGGLNSSLIYYNLSLPLEDC